MSYLIVESMKLVIEVEEDDIAPSEKKTLDELTKLDSCECEISIDDTDVSSLTFKEATILYEAYDIVNTLAGLDTDKLLSYWLLNRDIEYSVESEIDIGKFQRDGYIILEK